MSAAPVFATTGERAREGLRLLEIDRCPVCTARDLELSEDPPRFACAGGCDEERVGDAIYSAGCRLTGDSTRPFRDAIGEVVAAMTQARAQPRSVSVSNPPAPEWPAPPDSAAYQGLVGTIIDTIDPETESDRAAILAQLLVAFGNAVGRGPYFAVEASRHYPNINAVLVGQTAKGRKGTSWEHVRRLMTGADQQWASARILSGLSSGEGLIWAVRDPIVQKQPIKERGRIVEYEDVTTDAGVDDKRLLVTEPEFVRVLRVAGRDGNTLSSTIREAWDTGRLRVMTKNSPAVATDAHTSILGHITKDELLRNLGETDAANGFANRFLWVCVRRSKLLPEGGQPINLEPLALALSSSLSFARELGDRRIERDGEARAIWHRVYAALSADRPAMAGAIIGRAEAQVMRIALIYALLDRSPVIGARHLRAALALWEFVERSVRFIFGDSTGDRVADEILTLLRVTPTGVNRTELSAHFGRHLTAARLGAALDLLQRQRLASRTFEPSGGRPVERWQCEKGEGSETTQALSSHVSLISRGDGRG